MSDEVIKEKIRKALSTTELKEAMDEWSSNELPKITKDLGSLSYDEAYRDALVVAEVFQKASSKWDALCEFEWHDDVRRET